MVSTLGFHPSNLGSTPGRGTILKRKNTMSHLEKLVKTYTEIGIKCTVRTNREMQYLFIGEARSLHHDSSFDTGDLDRLTGCHNYMEFEKDGRLAAYSNS